MAHRNRNRTCTIGVIACLLGLSQIGSLGQSTRSDPQFAIAGRVLHAVTGEPAARALVKVNGGPPGRRMLTDAGGRFRFSGVNAGYYSVVVTKPQFEEIWTEIAGADWFNLGPSREDLELRLSPLASIVGTVVDGDGAPLRGVSIQAWDSRIVWGRRETTNVRSVSTDDRGRYRLWNLRPGRYYVKAAGRSGETRLYLGGRTPTFDSRECFEPAYFGGAPSISSATPLTIKAGQSVQADFRLPMQGAFKIRGSLTNFGRYRTINLELLSGVEDVTANRVAFNSSQGRFEIQDVVPGTYRLRAIQGERADAWAETQVQVSTSDMNDVTLHLTRGIDIVGTRHCEATERPRNGIPNPCTFIARLTGNRPEEHYNVDAAQNADFKFDRVIPGEYRIEILPLYGYVSAATAGGVDLLATHKLVIQPGAVAAPIDVWIRDDGAQIEGMVDVDGLKHDIQILLVPELPSAFGTRVDLIRSKTKFPFINVPPGEYSLYAFIKLDDIEYSNPQALRGYAVGARVRVAAKEHQIVKIGSLSQ
jgi:Carboxypeptidase regulatory-like domain